MTPYTMRTWQFMVAALLLTGAVMLLALFWSELRSWAYAHEALAGGLLAFIAGATTTTVLIHHRWSDRRNITQRTCKVLKYEFEVMSSNIERSAALFDYLVHRKRTETPYAEIHRSEFNRMKISESPVMEDYWKEIGHCPDELIGEAIRLKYTIQNFHEFIDHEVDRADRGGLIRKSASEDMLNGYRDSTIEHQLETCLAIARRCQVITSTSSSHEAGG